MCPNITSTMPCMFWAPDMGVVIPRVRILRSQPFTQLIIDNVCRGCDVHICTDRNFSHHHLASVGDGPSYNKPEYILSKVVVD
jgi:hypothetical protein